MSSPSFLITVKVYNSASFEIVDVAHAGQNRQPLIASHWCTDDKSDDVAVEALKRDWIIGPILHRSYRSEYSPQIAPSIWMIRKGWCPTQNPALDS